MKCVRPREALLVLSALVAVATGGCTTCAQAQRSGAYGEESANDAMLDYEREEEMRESDL